MFLVKSAFTSDVNCKVIRQCVKKTLSQKPMILSRSASSSSKKGSKGKDKECKQAKPEVCNKNCSGVKAPNQKIECFPVNRFAYRTQCMKPKFKTYKRVCCEGTAWATEPKFQPSDFRLDYNPKACEKPSCCLEVRADDTLYKSSNKYRKYQQTWSECVKLSVDPIHCPPYEFQLPEIERRKVKKNTETARGFFCDNNKTKCPYTKVACCAEGRKPPTCQKSKKPADCFKKCCPFPSFSECCLDNPLPPPEWCECGGASTTCVSVPEKKKKNEC